MVECPSCSAKNLETSKFCSECGCALRPVYAATATYRTAERHLPGDASQSSSDSHVHGRFLPGTKIAGRYRIVSLVGKGGMGEVYRADDLKLGQTVALKFLPKDFADDPQRLEYFHSEVRLSRQVSHPNVCRVYDIGEVDGQHFLSMEYVDGEDLASLIRRIGRLPPDKGVEIARQLCAGLAAAHDKGVLHRDLKPANVMLDGQGRVRITDFGLARLADDKGGRGVHAGTPAYMAPEQAAGRQVTERSDLYSLGLLLYEVFTGRSVISLRDSSAPPALLSIVPDIDSVMERVILRCLETEPERRPPSALAVAAAFPGGDPLAAALAAGETPSPEMVAAAGGEAGLSIALAVACLVIIGIGLPLACLLTQTTFLVNQVELKTPSALRDVAREWIEMHLKPPASGSIDEAHGFTVTTPLTGPLHYWYRRRCDTPLVPRQSGGFGKVALNSPPCEVPGEICIEMDGSGHLVRFQRVPPARFQRQVSSDAACGPTEWSQWFPEDFIGFRFQDFSEDLDSLKGLPLPNHPYDDIQAWKREGDESRPDQYVLAAAFEGQPTHFEVGPWHRQTQEMGGLEFYGVLMLFLAPIVAVLALRNLRSGRTDRRTVTRVASIIFGVGMFVYVLSADHQIGAAEFSVLTLALEASAFQVVFFGIWYSGLEPLVRRLWPETLVTWTRVFSGQLRDPLVGRDLLLGTAFGLLHLLIVQLGLAIPFWAGFDERLFAPLMEESLMGVRGSLSAVLQLQLDAFWICAFSLTLLTLLRRVLRYDILAIVANGAITAFGLVMLPCGSLAPAAWVPYALAIGAAWSLHAFVIVRFGFLPFFVAWTTVNVLYNLPLTTHLTAPCLDGTLVGLGVVLSVALVGFDMTLGGRPRRAVLQWIRGG